MSQIMIAGEVVPNWNRRETDLELWIFADETFNTSEGVTIPAGNQTNKNAFYKIPLVTDRDARTLTIPNVTLYSTIDSPNRPNAKYTAYIYRSNGALLQLPGGLWLDAFKVPVALASQFDSLDPTWADLRLYKSVRVPNQDVASYPRSDIDRMIANLRVPGVLPIVSVPFVNFVTPTGNQGISYATDRGEIYFDAGATIGWVSISGGIHLKALGAKSGLAVDSFLSSAILAATATGLPIIAEDGVYLLAGGIPGTAENIKIKGEGGAVVFRKSDAGELIINGHPYDGWTFENIELDQAYIGTITFSGSRDILIDKCKIRAGGITNQGSSRVRCIDTVFYGTRSGVMQSGVANPAAVPSASYGSAMQTNGGGGSIEYIRCRTHFVNTGFAASGSATNKVNKFSVAHCKFRNDYWNSPYITKYFTPTAYNNATKIATIGAGGMTGFFGNDEVCSVPIEIASGASFTGTFAKQIGATGIGTLARIGDEIRTSNGKRIEVLSIQSNDLITGDEWESVDTYEPTSAPANATSWKLLRYYAATAGFVSDTQIHLNFEPVNPFNGQLLVTGAGLSPVGVVCRTFAKTVYGGIHCNGGVEDFEALFNNHRGSWGDQCSVFNTNAPTILGSKFFGGQDEDITLTLCPGHIVMLCKHRFSGVSGCFSGSDDGVIVGNSYHSWGVVNRVGHGAIDGGGASQTITGNSCTVEPGASFGGASAYMVNLYADNVEGTVVAGNTDGGARVSTLNKGFGNGFVIARDLLSATGDVPNIASLRTRNTEYLMARNAANNGNVRTIGLDGSDFVQIAPDGNQTQVNGFLRVASAVPRLYMFPTSPGGDIFVLIANSNAQGDLVLRNDNDGVEVFKVESDCGMTFGKAIRPGTYTVATLPAGGPAATNGNIVYCSDATPGTNPATGGGTGALVFRQNGSWRAF
jgi:hypothetical protein